MAGARRARRDPGRERRNAQLVGAAGVLGAAVLPLYLWHDVVADISSVGDPGAVTLVGYAPWVLMALGLLCTIPIVVEHVRNRDRRFHRPGSGAWVGWGISLYLLGFALATQVAQLHGLHS